MAGSLGCRRARSSATASEGPRQPRDVARMRQRERLAHQPCGGFERMVGHDFVRVFAGMHGPVAGIRESVDNSIRDTPGCPAAMS
jgi:hypothetical protein